MFGSWFLPIIEGASISFGLYDVLIFSVLINGLMWLTRSNTKVVEPIFLEARH
jgi:hypothetical protein